MKNLLGCVGSVVSFLLQAIFEFVEENKGIYVTVIYAADEESEEFQDSIKKVSEVM